MVWILESSASSSHLALIQKAITYLFHGGKTCGIVWNISSKLHSTSSGMQPPQYFRQLSSGHDQNPAWRSWSCSSVLWRIRGEIGLNLAEGDKAWCIDYMQLPFAAKTIPPKTNGMATVTSSHEKSFPDPKGNLTASCFLDVPLPASPLYSSLQFDSLVLHFCLSLSCTIEDSCSWCWNWAANSAFALNWRDRKWLIGSDFSSLVQEAGRCSPSWTS